MVTELPATSTAAPCRERRAISEARGRARLEAVPAEAMLVMHGASHVTRRPERAPGRGAERVMARAPTEDRQVHVVTRTWRDERQVTPCPRFYLSYL